MNEIKNFFMVFVYQSHIHITMAEKKGVIIFSHNRFRFSILSVCFFFHWFSSLLLCIIIIILWSCTKHEIEKKNLNQNCRKQKKFFQKKKKTNRMIDIKFDDDNLCIMMMKISSLNWKNLFIFLWFEQRKQMSISIGQWN